MLIRRFKTIVFDYLNGFYSNLNILNNLSAYKGGKKTYAYYIDFLSNIGGTEKRLELLFQKIIDEGARVVVLTRTRTVNRYILRNCKVYFVDPRSTTFIKDIVNILLSENIVNFEINHTPNFIVKKENIEYLKSFFSVGIHLHHKTTDSVMRLVREVEYNYKIINSEKHIVNYGADAVIIRNAIELYKIQDVYHNGHQKTRKAILISRLDDDKLNSIESAIKYLTSNAIEFEVAGDNTFCENISSYLISKYKINESQFIGAIDTYVYLKEHIDDYFFVAGVGQVIIEAGSLGFPVLCADLFNEASFITKKNFAVSLESNLTTIDKSLCSSIDISLVTGNEELNVCSLILESNCLEYNFKKYIETIG